jgi:hypothetical protein
MSWQALTNQRVKPKLRREWLLFVDFQPGSETKKRSQ